MEWPRRLLNGVVNLIWPDVCEVCGCSLVRGEKVICLGCRLNLPRTNLHNQDFGPIHHRLAGRVPIERAAGYFYYYRSDPFTRLIHAAKYNGRPDVARYLAKEYAMEIKPDGFFSGIDLILPVPLHRFKHWKRGYNQSEYLARGLEDATGIAVGHNLVATRGHSTQTRKGAYLRWLNTRNIYDVKLPQELDGKHILVVDDVLTTGATLLACCEVLHRKVPTATISVLTLAVSHLR